MCQCGFDDWQQVRYRTHCFHYYIAIYMYYWRPFSDERLTSLVCCTRWPVYRSGPRLGWCQSDCLLANLAPSPPRRSLAASWRVPPAPRAPAPRRTTRPHPARAAPPSPDTRQAQRERTAMRSVITVTKQLRTGRIKRVTYEPRSLLSQKRCILNCRASELSPKLKENATVVPQTKLR